MGIPRFLKDILSPLNVRLNGRLIRPIEEIQGQQLGVLAVDMNSLLHEEAQYIYKYGEYETDSNQIQDMTPEQLFEQYIERVYEVVMDIHEQLPSDILILSYDGVATLGKINQQKSRRYRALYNEKRPGIGIDHTETEKTEDVENEVPVAETSPVFNSNALTPGTNFMIDLTAALRTRFVDAFADSPTVLIYADTRGHGEGEQKILNTPYGLYQLMDYNKRHVIYGSDGDLILMTLAKDVPDILVYRADTGAVDIGLMRRHIIEEGYTVDDYIFLCMLLGNDFVPATPLMEDASFSLSRLQRAYLSMSRSSTTNVPYRLIDQNKRLNVDRFMDLLNRLLVDEVDSILYLSQNRLREDFIYSNAVRPKRSTTSTRSIFRDRRTGTTTTRSTVPSNLDTTNIEQLKQYYEVDMSLFRYLWNVNMMGYTAESAEITTPESAYYRKIFIEGLVPQTYELTDINVGDAVSNYIDALMWSFRFIAYGTAAPPSTGTVSQSEMTVPFINGDYVYPYYYAPTIHDILSPTVRDNVQIVSDSPPSIAQIDTRIQVMRNIGVPSIYLLTRDYYNTDSISKFKSTVTGRDVAVTVLFNEVYMPTIYHPLSVVATVIPYETARDNDDFLDEETARLIYQNDGLINLGIFNSTMSLSSIGKLVDYQYILYVPKIDAATMDQVDRIIRNDIVPQLPSNRRLDYVNEPIYILERTV